MKSLKQPTALHSRRSFVAGAVTLPWFVACSTSPGNPNTLRDIEISTGGRIGVAAIDLSDGAQLVHRDKEQFAMCSTFKWVLAALVLQDTDHHRQSLDRFIKFDEKDLVSYSPVTKDLAAQGGGTVEALCIAAVSKSDNTAANLLLNTVGGPQGFTNRVRKFGDTHTRLDRIEPFLNENAPGDPRDTSTPGAMLKLMQTLLFDTALSADSRTTLQTWMINTTTGLNRLRAGFPANWIGGDKTGTSENNANNDLAFALPPQNLQPAHGPILIVCFTNTPEPLTAAATAIHAQVAKAVFRQFT